MKTLILSFVAILFVEISFGQEVVVQVESSRGVESIDYIEVTNLRTNTSTSVVPDKPIVFKAINSDNAHFSHNSVLFFYPNPASDFVNFDFFISEQSQVSIIISGISGHIVAQSVHTLQKGDYQGMVTNLPSGIYFVAIRLQNKTLAGKVVSIGNSKGNPTISINEGILNEKNVLTFDGNPTIDYSEGTRYLFSAKAGDVVTKEVIEPKLRSFVDIDLTECVDADGNIYPTVKIGEQLWMGRNLRTTRFSNGEPIPSIIEDAVWKSTLSPALCIYNNEMDNEGFGLLYNGFVATDSRNVCPLGWKVPTDDDWNILLQTISAEENVGKEALLLVDSKLWENHEYDTETLAFDAVPSGLRYAHNGAFGHINVHGRWWTSTVSDDGFIWNRYINADKEFLGRGKYNPRYGYSIRCIKE